MKIIQYKTDAISFLYASGIAAAALSVFGMYNSIGLAILLLLGLHIFSALFGGNKKSKWIGFAVLLGVVAILLVSGAVGDFVFQSIQMAKALALFIQGSNNLFLAYGQTVAILLALLLFLLSKLFSDDALSFIPMLLLLIVLLYCLMLLGAHMQALYTLPAWFALLLKALHKQKARDYKAYIAIVSILAITFALLPLSKKNVSPLNPVAKEIQERIRDYLFFTEEREIFSLEDYGFYPFGLDRFGGKPTTEEHPVLSLKTNKKVLLRGIAKDYYTGMSFQNSKKTGRYLYINPRWYGLRSKSLLENYPLGLKTEGILTPTSHEVKLYTNIHTTLLAPAYVRKLTTNSDMIPYFNESGELFITRNLKPDDIYTFEAPIIEAGNVGLPALIAHSATSADPNYNQIAQSHLQLPNHLEPALFELQQKIIKDAKTPYEQGLAIMNFLKSNYRYNLDVKEPPQNVDFVTYFLFGSREGYCTYFASAMTVLARMSGLPARYVEGFLAMPDRDGLARVTTKQAHAWAEIYFSGFGWVPFDAIAPIRENPPENNENNPPPEQDPPPQESPTPPPPEEQDTPPEQEPEPTPSPAPTPPPPDTPEPPPQKNPNGLLPFLFWLLLLLALASGSLFSYFSQPLQRLRNIDTQEGRIKLLAKAILCMLQNYGKHIKPYQNTQTLLQYVEQEGRHYPVNLMPFANAVNQCVYSNASELYKEENICQETLRILYAQAPWYKKIQFYMQFVTLM